MRFILRFGWMIFHDIIDDNVKEMLHFAFQHDNVKGKQKSQKQQKTPPLPQK